MLQEGYQRCSDTKNLLRRYIHKIYLVCRFLKIFTASYDPYSILNEFVSLVKKSISLSDCIALFLVGRKVFNVLRDKRNDLSSARRPRSYSLGNLFSN